MRLAQKRGQHVRRNEIEIVVRPVKIRRHGGDEIGAVLAGISLAKFDAGNLGDGIRFVRRLEQTGEKRIFRNRLRRVLRINA